MLVPVSTAVLPGKKEWPAFLSPRETMEVSILEVGDL